MKFDVECVKDCLLKNNPVTAQEKEITADEWKLVIDHINQRRQNCDTLIIEGCRRDKCFICPKENSCKLWHDDDNDMTDLCKESGRALTRTFLNKLNKEEASASSSTNIVCKTETTTQFVNLKCTNPECGMWFAAHIQEVLAGMYKLQEPCEFCGSPTVLRSDQESRLSIEQTITKLRSFGIEYKEEASASSSTNAAPFHNEIGDGTISIKDTDGMILIVGLAPTSCAYDAASLCSYGIPDRLVTDIPRSEFIDYPEFCTECVHAMAKEEDSASSSSQICDETRRQICLA